LAGGPPKASSPRCSPDAYVGKTYLIKEFLRRELDQKERKYVYVSLYGLSSLSLEEIDEALLGAIYPALGWKATKIAARVGKSLLKRVGVDADVKITDLVNRFDPNVFIFDDLERYEAPINKALGYINQFVEHDGCKVILVANEDEISEGDDYGGLGIHENETAEYRELFAYLKQKAKHALEDSYPSKGIALLDEMKSDPALFFRRVCLTNSEDNIYYRVPILASIDPDAFVSSFLSLHPAHQRTVMMALKSRYEHNTLESELVSEKYWLQSAISKLMEKAGSMSEIGRYRLLKNIEWHIPPIVSEQVTS
jgi:hypothetical protein